VLNSSSNFRLASVLAPLGFVGLPLDFAYTLVGPVQCGRRLAGNQFLLAGVRAVTVDEKYFAMQQAGKWVLVVHVRGGDDCAVNQAGVAVHADVQLHAEIPLLPLRV
jgi:hypothetical protein